MQPAWAVRGTIANGPAMLYIANGCIGAPDRLFIAPAAGGFRRE